MADDTKTKPTPPPPPKPKTVTLTVGELLTVAGAGWSLLHRAKLTPGAAMELRRVMDTIVKPKLDPDLLARLEIVLHRGEADDSMAAVRQLMGDANEATA